MNWKLLSGERVIDRQRSHLHDGTQDLLGEVLGRIDPRGCGFIVEAVDLGRIVGQSTRVKTGAGDEIVYAQRHGRSGLTRFVKNRQGEPTNAVTVILKKGDCEDYVLITAWIGTQAEPEPWDRNANANSRDFWPHNALLWGSEPVISGTETKVCPW